MAELEIANEALKVNFEAVAPVLTPPIPLTGITYSSDQPIDAVKIVALKALKTKADSSFVCKTSITLAFVVGTAPCPYSSTTYLFVAGAGSIAATAAKVKVDNAAVLRKDDTGECLGTWTLIASPYTLVNCKCNLKISDAGQTKVKGE